MSNPKSIIEMCGGAFIERADYEIGKILENIADVNTEPNKKRTLTLKFEFTPNMDRNIIKVIFKAEKKVVPYTPVETGLYLKTENGNSKAYELIPDIPGQMGINGTIQTEPTELKIILDKTSIKDNKGDMKDVR